MPCSLATVLAVGLCFGTANLLTVHSRSGHRVAGVTQYCARRPASNRCCTERSDDCSVPIKDSLCYCDQYCNQHSSEHSDCCPDYQETCKALILAPPSGKACFYESANYPVGYTFRKKCVTCTCTKVPGGTEMTCVDTCRPPPSSQQRCHKGSRHFEIGERFLADECTECACIKSIDKRHSELQCSDICGQPATADRRKDPITECEYRGKTYAVGHKLRDGCHECKCRIHGERHAKMECVNVCPKHSSLPSHPSIVHAVNRGYYGWTAHRYSFLAGKSMDDIYRERTGICRPGTTVLNPTVFNSHNFHGLKKEFDARDQWPGWIQGIRDQLGQPNSWAITTAELISDRMAVQTNGEESHTLSVWNLVDCVQHKRVECKSSSEAWQHIHQYGITTEQCYPDWTSSAGKVCKVSMEPTSYTTECPNGQQEGYLYRMSLQYKVSDKEDFIRMEIQNNGPVQAHLRVKPDFFYYRSGVYRHVPESTSAHHFALDHYYLAVRILGWGVDHSLGTATKYWLCSNSWGREWGEGGYFRIVRGENEAEVEANVIGVWPKSALVDAAVSKQEP